MTDLYLKAADEAAMNAALTAYPTSLSNSTLQSLST